MQKLFSALGEKKLYYLGALSIITAAIFWSLDGIFLRPHLYTLSPAVVVFWEHLLGFIVLSPWLWFYRKELKFLSRKQWLAVFWISLFGGALGTVFITKAFFLTNFQDLSIVLLLQKLQPIFAILLAYIFLGEKLRRKFYLWAALAVMAGYFVTFKDLTPNFDTGEKTIMAAFFAALAAFAFGSSTTFGKYAIRTINYKLLAGLRFGLTTIIMLAAVMYLRILTLPGNQQWLILIIVVFTSGALAMFLYYYGLKKVTASQATLYELAWPISAIIMDFLINKNMLSWSQLLAAAILIYAVYKIVRLQPTYRNIIGKVIAGQGIGGQLGYKTANLNPGLAKYLTTGVYFVQTNIDGKTYSALLHYGHNTLQNKMTLELLIQGLTSDIYNKKIEVRIDHKVRETKKFKNREEAIKSIGRDYQLLK